MCVRAHSVLKSIKAANVKRVAEAFGFKVLLAWYFIVLFTPLLAVNQSKTFDSLVFTRQFALYLSLALSFLVLSFLRDRLQRISKPIAIFALHAGVGVTSVLATSAALVVSFNDETSSGLLLATSLLLGCCGALSIHLWVHRCLKSRIFKKRRALVFNMVSSAILAFFTLSLQSPLSWFVVAALPGLAGLALLVIRLSDTHQEKERSVSLSAQTQQVLHRRFARNHLPSVVFALTFGLMQGAFIETDIVFFLASSPLILLGITFSGAVIYLIKEKGSSYEEIDTMHRISLILLVIGVLGISFFRDVSPVYLSKATLLAGFVLFDFGSLVLSMSMARKVGLAKAHLIDKGRSVVYFGFTLGLTVAFFCCRLFDEGYNDVLIRSFGGVALVLLVVTVMIRLSRITPTERVLVEETVSLSSQQREVPGSMITMLPDVDPKAPSTKSWMDACAEIAKVHQLSPRETEVFMMLGKGRNAEYIQGKLVISLHTAKSHISNIYQKLGVHSIQEMLDLIELYSQ